jgi:nickel/cobalt transporter (NicO) family protein
VDFLIAAQRWIQAAVSDDLSTYAATREWTLLAAVFPLGLLFGAIHALTPGHGKAVLASYVVGSRLALTRGLAVAGTLASVHVLSAVVLAFTAAWLVTRTLGGAGRAPALENISRGMLIAIGLWLFVRAIRGQTHRHGEGLMVGVIAGLIPCPLTLFAMFLALSRGVPEAGLTFAPAMMFGVAFTLGAVATGTILARDTVLKLIDQHGGSPLVAPLTPFGHRVASAQCPVPIRAGMAGDRVSVVFEPRERPNHGRKTLLCFFDLDNGEGAVDLVRVESDIVSGFQLFQHCRILHPKYHRHAVHHVKLLDRPVTDGELLRGRVYLGYFALHQMCVRNGCRRDCESNHGER